MPHMVCCKKKWSVGSDDFVVSSVVGVIFRLVWLGGLIAFSIVVLEGRDCFPEGTRKNMVHIFIYSQIFIQTCVLVSEVLIALISSRGTVNDVHSRRHLPHFLRLRAILYFIEVLGVAFGGYVAWSPYIHDHIDCERANRVKQAIKAYVISVIVILTIIAIMFLMYYDPLGLQTPSLLTELHTTQSDDDKDKGGASSGKQWARRIRMLCCCVGGRNSRTKVKALEDIASSMATIFHGVDIVLSDFVTALMLVHRDQKKKMNSPNYDPTAELKNITYQRMEDKPHLFFTPNYDKHAAEEKVDFSIPETQVMMRNIKHYLKFALGIYGWPLHVYLNPIRGSVCLCAHLRCRTINSHSSNFVKDNCCLANTAALKLRSHLKDKDVIYANHENNDLSELPFSLCFDHPNKAVVLSIRGSMSLKDALTDMHISMEDIRVDDDKYRNLITKVHCGMHRAAQYVIKQVDGRLQALLTSDKYHDYKLIITGHSLGAGIGAVLAVLYHNRYRDLHCYAFSPPGALFTLPVVEYSKSFITTIVYQNDVVPRLTLRGLLYLKKNMAHLFYHCKLPKHAVLCPSLFSCCYGKYHDHHHQQEFNPDIYDHTAEKGILKTTISHDYDNQPKKVHPLVKQMYEAEKEPAFVPGRVLYIKKTGKKVHRRFWNIFGETEVDAVWKPNEDFCHIIVDTGMFNHHLPDSVLSVVNNLYNQRITGKDNVSETNSSSVSTDPISLQPQPSTTTGLHKKAVQSIADVELDPQSDKYQINTSQSNGAVLGTNQQIDLSTTGHFTGNQDTVM